MDSERGTPEVLLIEIVVSQPAVVDHRLSKNDSNIVLFTSNMHSHHIQGNPFAVKIYFYLV